MLRTGSAPVTDSAGELALTGTLKLSQDEFEVRATTGGGPGGQHVNRSQTRIELRWNPTESAGLREALSPDHRERVLARLRPRLDSAGVLRLVAAEHRSQRRNRDAALMRLAAIIRGALPDPVPRRKTKPTRGSVERRLQEKKRRSEVKRGRGRVSD